MNIDLEDLVREVNATEVMEGSGRTFMEDKARSIIDRFERQMDLFCWGPNGAMRRIVDRRPSSTAGPDFCAFAPSPATMPVSSSSTECTDASTPATSVADHDDEFEMIFSPTELEL